MYRFAIVIALLLPLSLGAQESGRGPLFMKHLVEGQTFFDPWGLGIDFFTMEQDYEIEQLQFVLPGVAIEDPSNIRVRNEVQHLDVKLDVWITPFLNVFALVGHVDADTYVDLSQVPVAGLPFNLGTLPVTYDGTVYGVGLNLVYGGERWFAALNNTWTDTDLGGDFESSVESFAVQPRIGLVRGGWVAWLGGMYLDTEESHRGAISLPLPGLPPVPFSVDLTGVDHWNYAVGVGYVFSPGAHLSLEVGFGDREHTLLNYTWRF